MLSRTLQGLTPEPGLPTSRRRIGSASLAGLAALLLIGSSAFAAQSGRQQGRNYDARLAAAGEAAASPAPAQLQALDALRTAVPELAVEFEPTTGATRSLYNRVGYLSGPAGGDPMDAALGFVRDNLVALGLGAEDLAGFEVTDSVYSKVSGSTHLYLRQTFDGLPVYNGQLHVNVNRDGRILSVNNAFVPAIARAVNATSPSIDATEAVRSLARQLDLSTEIRQLGLQAGADPRRTTRISASGLAVDEIKAQLMLLPMRAGDVRLVWNFQAETPDSLHWYDVTVDALSGEVLTRFDWTNSGTYRVYEQPVEDPEDTTPAPPGDGRTLAVNPEDATASPSGWFTGGTMDGNNVHACPDASPANNVCDSNPQCSGTTCDFGIDLTAAPSASIPAATANLFYWNNIIHDIQYQYGFDEPGGNFQENNFGNGGAGGDSVNADAQDGGGNCNANFATPTDGGNPRMQMFTCTNASPARDGDYDNGVIVHEYGHGISIRQVGGPGNSSCLNNSQQAGEGWSDWHALVYTARASHTGPQARGLGAYLFNTAVTIRDLPYSTDPGVNNWTYQSISGASIPHGVGSRWAQAAWEVYWTLVDKWGFEGDLVNFDIGDPNEAGNKRALFYINQGLKNTACSPTFVNNRDGIIQAATDNFGGADVCDIWEAFAAFGLGTDAVSGGSNSTNPTNGFSIPAACECDPQPIADAGPDVTICQGDSATIGTPAQPSNTYSWSPGGATTAQITVTPAVTTTYTVTATTTCGSASDSVTVTVDDGSSPGLSEDFEGGLSGWTTTGLWHLTSDSACATPGYSSPVNAVYYGQDASCNYDTGGTTTGTLTSPSISGITSTSTLSFDYFRVVESFSGDFDQTDVEIVTSGGSTTVFELNSSNPSTAAWVSSGTIPLGSFAGQTIQVRFRFNSGDGVANNFTGWFVDDVVVTGESSCTPGNTPPAVSITAPADGSTFTVGDSVTFSGTAADAEDGDISASLSWTSSIDGAIGSGATFSTTALSVGNHTITASVTDSGGLPGSDSISVTVNPPANTPPVVSITAPADGSTFTVGDSVTFSGTANDAEDGDISASLGWTSSIDGTIGSGATFSTTALSVGNHTITASVTDSGGLPGSDSISITVEAAPGGGCPAGTTQLHAADFESGAGGWINHPSSTCSTGTFVQGTPTQVVNGGVTTQVAGAADGVGAWFTATNTAAGVNDVDNGTCDTRSPAVSAAAGNIIVSFDYFHGQRDAGGDDGFVVDVLNNGAVVATLVNFGGVTNNAVWTPVSANVNLATAGDVSLRVRATDGPSGGDLVEGGIDNVLICGGEGPPPPPCTVDDDFEAGAPDWVNEAASTCTTGAYVVGNPTNPTGGFQVVGSNSGVNSLFTATNSSSGVNDVDGGNCILGSPTWSVANASTLSVAWWHGQRDAGDDPSGDFFRLEYSLNGGSSWTVLRSNGDSTSNPVWATATAPIPAGSNVRVRVQCSDGAGPGDLVECGIDDVSICE